MNRECFYCDNVGMAVGIFDEDILQWTLSCKECYSGIVFG
jgi:hypothetical protein